MKERLVITLDTLKQTNAGVSAAGSFCDLAATVTQIVEHHPACFACQPDRGLLLRRAGWQPSQADISRLPYPQSQRKTISI